jgi:hypothetical protein
MVTLRGNQKTHWGDCLSEDAGRALRHPEAAPGAAAGPQEPPTFRLSGRECSHGGRYFGDSTPLPVRPLFRDLGQEQPGARDAASKSHDYRPDQDVQPRGHSEDQDDARS